MIVTGKETYGGCMNSGHGYMDYEFYIGEFDLFQVTYSLEDQSWYATYRSASTPDGSYGEPVDLENIDVFLLRGRIPFGDMPQDYLMNYASLWDADDAL